MDLIPRTSYAKDFFDLIKSRFESGRYNGDTMDCADMFRNDEWKVVDDADYGENTRTDLIAMARHNPEFQRFVEAVIESMEYNKKSEDKISMKLSKELQQWVDIDDACHIETIKGRHIIVSYHDTSNPELELPFIINRIKSLYAAGGAVETIHVIPETGLKLDRSITDHGDCQGIPDDKLATKCNTTNNTL